jgi:GNAT superfamily N-acetyltransferase
MTRIETRPFDEGFLADAGRLLAERHRRHRLASPLLSPRYEDPAVAEAEVAAAAKADDASGAVATRGGEVVGYLLGAPKPSATWGPNVWVEASGTATVPGDPEVSRQLYGAAATRWVDEGRTAHYVLLPAHDEDLRSAWFRLAFGHQHTHAVRTLAGAVPPVPEALTVRRAERPDIPVLARLDLELPRHQGLSPTFSAGPTSTYEEALAEWEDEDFEDPEVVTFVVEHDGAVVGSAVGCPLAKSSSHAGPNLADDAGFLGFAAVLPQARGLGAGRALGEAVRAWAADAGFACIGTDWRETNLTSSRAWRALGYQDTFTRVHRLLGH